MNILVKYTAEPSSGPEMVGGIYVPQKRNEKPQGTRQGIVMAIGSGKNKRNEDIGFSVEVGDSVLVPTFNGTHIRCDDGMEYCLIDATEVLATVGE